MIFFLTLRQEGKEEKIGSPAVVKGEVPLQLCRGSFCCLSDRGGTTGTIAPSGTGKSSGVEEGKEGHVPLSPVPQSHPAAEPSYTKLL